jgi:hypothetical protein
MMTPKKALLILSPFIALLLLTLAMIIIGQLYFDKPLNSGKKAENGIVSQEQSPAEAPAGREIEAIITEKVKEKQQEIENKPADKPYTQDEIDFILSPRKTVEKELIDEAKARQGL